MNVSCDMSTDETSFLDGYLPYLLRRADQTLSAPFYALLAQYGVALSEWRVLAVLHELGELCVADLAEAALSVQPTVTHASRRLEDRGLLSSAPGTDDKRQRFLSITAAGTSLISTLIEKAKQLEADALSEAGDLSDLIQQLQELTANVHQRGTSYA